MQKHEIFEIIKKQVLDISPDLDPEMIQIDSNLEELGLNSIDRVEVVMLSMEDLQLKIPRNHLGLLETIQELVDFFLTKSSERKP